MSNIGRVVGRDSSRSMATINDLFVALCEDDSIFVSFKTMKGKLLPTLGYGFTTYSYSCQYIVKLKARLSLIEAILNLIMDTAVLLLAALWIQMNLLENYSG